MFLFHNLVRRGLLVALLLLTLPALLHAQGIRPRPTWWFGGSAGANINWYNGTAQVQNDTLIAPAPFHKGSGVGPYVALGIEYRPSNVWGGMLYVGYDDRRGSWDDIILPCDDCPASMSTTLSYISIEPSLRVAPFAGRLHMFVGPRIGVNMAKTFTYQEDGQPEVEGDWSDIRSTVVSGQIGMGYDISLSSQHDRTQVELSPFASFHPYFGQDPRTVENWAVSTLRVGVVLKVGRTPAAARPTAQPVVRPIEPVVEPTPVPVVTPDPDTTGQAERERQARMAADMARIQVILFDYDQSSIRSDQRERVRSNAEIFRTWPEWSITVEGHCDERGTNEYNLALGERRASLVRQALVKDGINVNRISIASYGEERPADPGSNEAAWGRNRRAEISVK